IPGTARHAHTDARHAFHAASDHQIVGTESDLGRSQIDRIEARSAEARNLHARRLEVVTGFESGRTRNDRASFADRIDAAENNVVYLGGVDAVSVTQGFQNLRAQTNGRHFVQGPA